MPYGYRYEIQLMCYAASAPRALFTFNRRAPLGRFEARHLRLLEALSPHIGAAMHAATARAALAAAGGQADRGLIVLDAEGAIELANPAALRLLAVPRAFDLRSACRVFLGRRRRDLAAGRAPVTPAMTLSLGELGSIHLIGESCVGADSRPRMTVMLDPARPSDTPDLLLRIGLTPREAALATRLVRGDSLDDAARALGCAAETARSHLKRVFTKLGVGSRRELILTLMADNSRGIVPAGPDGIP